MTLCSLFQLRKNQQRVLYVLQGHEVEHEEIDIARVNNQEERDFMHVSFTYQKYKILCL